MAGRQKHRQTGRHKRRDETDRQTDKTQTDKLTDTGRQTGRQTGRLTDKTDRQTGSQTDRQTEQHTNTHARTHTTRYNTTQDKPSHAEPSQAKLKQTASQSHMYTHLSSDSTKKVSVSSTPSISHRGLDDRPQPSQSLARTWAEAVSSPRLRCQPPTPMPYPWHKTTGI